ncbi:CUE domain-containing protein-like protein [Hapsidospora chrysogenum ATCC 11550]|uniref:CUE domain-containing protein-like protein n=1 Tax=Hapsidospora chrysogenum (strain ATCC 11550 / CBS 779.69 / DSM 880 / IAM 14645 / JCM 23072 / IMI 49137) TaxID=857340 RepID=A0A086T9L2_HAPC1|nr:CUE domain-containing protein-like protein [Hapsidospora chrysogenum ATCC 11550]
MAALPPFAPFPQAPWRQHLTREEWDALLEAWALLSQACLGLPDEDFSKKAAQDESMGLFVASFMNEVAESSPSSLGSYSTRLLKSVFQLSSRLLSNNPPTSLLSFDFLSSFSRVYPAKHTSQPIAKLFINHGPAVEASLTSLKKLLIPHLDAGIKGDLKLVESRLLRLNPLLHASPHACTLFLAGSDFFDGLVTCFRVMNPPLRKVIITTVYLCLVGLTEAEPPKWAMLNDQLYALKAAADAHKAGPINANDSLVPELVTSTPILKVLLRRAESSSSSTEHIQKRIAALQEFKKGPTVRPKRLVRRKIDKGKGKQTVEDVQTEMHVHKMSQITQVQDLFPDLGAGFVSKCLDEYADDVEQVVANLLGETLPPHLASADRNEPLSSQPPPRAHPDLAPHVTPTQLPTRHNKYDDDEFDRLAADVSKISFGKNHERTTKEVQSSAPNKAAILSALAAFDSDDDERDDTYDAADVGGTVDSTNQEADGVSDGNEEVLFRAYQMDEKVFGRDAGTRRGPARSKLRDETGMTDEAIEGWAVMLTRNPQQRRRLEAKYAFSGEQVQIERTSWRPSPADSGAEDSDAAGGSFRGGRGGRGRGRGGGGGGGRGGGGRGRGGNVAGPAGDKGTESARRNKEANKGSRANHNRREGRARKMARGGFGP